MIRKIVIAGLLSLSAVVGHAADEPKLVTPGELSWGTGANFAPFEFIKDGKIIGFDADMMEEISKRLGLKSTPSNMEFAGIIPALATGHRLDTAVSSIYVTPARLEVVDMIPYLLIGDQIVVPAGNPGKITSKDDLCGHHIAVTVNTNWENKLKILSATCTAASKSPIDILSIQNSVAVALALTQGRAEGTLSTGANIVALIDANPGSYEAVGEPFDVTTKIGIGVAKDNPILKAQIESALKAMVKDGTYTKLIQKWHLPANSSIF